MAGYSVAGQRESAANAVHSPAGYPAGEWTANLRWSTTHGDSYDLARIISGS